MKTKATLALMELLVMVLVFSLAVAACLGIFTYASQMAAETARREEAALLAQNGAEWIKSGRSLESLALPSDFGLTLQREVSPVSGLGLGRLDITWEGDIIYSLNIGWQEDMP